MNSILKLLLIFFFITNCSLDNKTGLWSKNNDIIIENKNDIKEIFNNDEISDEEFNPNVLIKIVSKLKKNNQQSNYNNDGRLDYDGNLKSISRYKFSKIDKFNQIEPEIIFNNDNIIFFDDKGSIIQFNNNSKIVWKKNYYTKREKKTNPILFFFSSDSTLIIADYICKYYAININTGDLLWTKKNLVSFNSQIKIFKDRFFIIDLNNTIKSYSIKNGNELWSYTTEKTFLKSQKKLSLIVHENSIIFNNSTGDITSLDTNDGRLIWQTPTQNSLLYEDTFFLKTSDMIADKKSIIFSNNKNELFSLDIKTGILNWQQKINSDLKSIIVNDLIITVTLEGFLVITNKLDGNILRITNIFTSFKKKKKSKIKPIGFVMGKKNIYLTLNNGRLLVIDNSSGKTLSVVKIDNNKISRPFITNQKLYIIKDNSIIKLN